MKILMGFMILFIACVNGTSQQTIVLLQDAQNAPIVGARIQIVGTKLLNLTDDSGKVQLALSEGRFRMLIDHLGYQSIDTSVLLGSNATIVFTMKDQWYTFGEVELLSTWIKEKTPFTFNNYDKAYIERNNLGQDIPFILQWTPSVVSTSDAGAGIGYTGIRIRGSDPTRINVTINGVPLNDSESQGVFWVNMPDFASSTEQIQIQRGAGSSTNGAGAFGATINLSTQKINTKPHGSLSATLGSFNTRRINALAGTGLLDDKFTLDFRVSSIQSDGYVDRASSDLNSFQMNAAYLGKKSSLKFNIISGKEITYQAWNGLPYQYINDPELRTFNISGARRDGTFYDNQVDDYTQTHYQLIHQYSFSDRLYSNLTLHYTRGFGFFEEFRENDRLNRYRLNPIVIGESTISRTDIIRRRWLDNHFGGAIYSLDYASSDKKDQVTWGIAYNEYYGDHFGELIWMRVAGPNNYLDRYYFNDAKKTDFNTFLKYNRLIGEKWSVFGDLQYRRVTYTYQGDNNAGRFFDGNETFDFFNPKTGIYYSDKGGNDWFLSVATAAREPNRRDFTDTDLDNRPKPEFMLNPEMGFKKQGKNYNLAANLYWMYYKDQLVLTGELNDVGAAIRTNVDRSYRAGLELEGAWIWEGIQVGAAATFSRNKAIEFIEKIDNWDTGQQISVEHKNTDLAFSPNIIANFQLGYQMQLIKIGQISFSPEITLLTKYVGDQYLDNTSNPDALIDAYWFSDLRLTVPLQYKNQVFKISFWINNLWDNLYVSNGWIYRFQSEGYNPISDDPYARRESLDNRYNLTGLFPQAGRNWLLGIQYLF
jgi:iron complex outermembrane receptor protein